MAKLLGEYLFADIDKDEFLTEQYKSILREYIGTILNNESFVYSDNHRSLLRYADLLSLSSNQNHQNLAQQISIILSVIFPEETEVNIFKRNIYKNVSNFVSANIIESHIGKIEKLDFLRSLEIEVHKIDNLIPGTNHQFFDTQKVALDNLNKNKFYSFSAPTSMGKTFIIKSFIRSKLKGDCCENFVIVVPTRALLSEIANSFIMDFKDLLGENKHKVVTSLTDMQENDKFIAVLTPERLYYALLKNPYIKIGFVFIDEAHKISDIDKRSIIYYKILDMLKHNDDVSVYFSSPIIPNPDIYLELTNYYQENDAANGQAFIFSPVMQNKIYIDLDSRKISILDTLSKKIETCGDLPEEIKSKIDTLITLGKDKCNLIYVSSSKKAVDYAVELSRRITLDDISQSEKDHLESVARQIENKIHKEYFLAGLIRKRVAYHIGALPAEIRSQVEKLIRDGIIKYCFCTSTLLEGVNVPVDNLFIFDNKKALSYMSEIDAFNLMGRAGRVTLNEYGNVFIIIQNDKIRKYYDKILLNELPNQKLIPSKAIKKKHKLHIVNTLLQGKTNLLESGETFKDKGFTETTYDYASKCLNILLDDIRSKNDSYIISDFKNDGLLTPQSIIKIREIFGSNIDEDSDINISAKQKEALYNAVLLESLNYPSTLEYEECYSFLLKLSQILKWDIYEKNTLGYGNSIKYYAVLLTQWMNGKGLHRIINASIKHYQINGGKIVSYEPTYHLENYNDSPEHKNMIINNAMKDIEQIINYKFSMYFLRLSETIIGQLGEGALIHDWYEYVEYGTNNDMVILLQKYGFLREEALDLLKSPFGDYIIMNNKKIAINSKILELNDTSLIEKIRMVKINYPEIFFD